MNRTKALYIKLRVEALQNEAGLNKVQQQPSHAAYTEDTGSQRIGLAASDDRQDQSNTFLVSDTHPWRRFFARMVDTWTTYFVPGFALGFVLGDFNLPAFLLLLIGVVMSLFIEAGLISLFGATPAKWLFGIRVVHPDGSLLTFDDALNRSFLVFVQGLGFCIPFIAPFTQLFAYRRLTKTGTTSWDASSNAVVHHEKLDLLQTLVCIVAVLVALMIHGYAMNLMVANLAKDVMNEMNRKGQSMQRKYGQSEEPATSSASNVESKKTSLQNANEGAGDDAELAAIKKQVGWATLLPTRNVQARKTGYNRRTATPDRGHLARPLCVQGGGALSRAT